MMHLPTPTLCPSRAFAAPHVHQLSHRPCSRSPVSRNRDVTTCAHNIKARWLVDIRYGVKLEAVALLQEWVGDIGAQAGLTPFNASINSGAVGVPESRLELEVAFDSMAELEAFWGAIPPERHRAWSQRAQHLIVDGSPTWQVFRTCAPTLPQSGEAAGAAHASTPSQAAAEGRQRGQPRPQLPFASTDSPAPKDLQFVDGAEEAAVALDWKGDPMKINPGDRMPFF